MGPTKQVRQRRRLWTGLVLAGACGGAPACADLLGIETIDFEPAAPDSGGLVEAATDDAGDVHAPKDAAEARAPIVDLGSVVTGLAADDEALYWTNEAGELRRMVHGATTHAVLVKGDVLRAVTVLIPQVYWLEATADAGTETRIGTIPVDGGGTATYFPVDPLVGALAPSLAVVERGDDAGRAAYLLSSDGGLLRTPYGRELESGEVAVDTDIQRCVAGADAACPLRSFRYLANVGFGGLRERAVVIASSGDGGLLATLYVSAAPGVSGINDMATFALPIGALAAHLPNYIAVTHAESVTLFDMVTNSYLSFPKSTPALGPVALTGDRVYWAEGSLLYSVRLK